jgi:GTP-binding protein
MYTPGPLSSLSMMGSVIVGYNDCKAANKAWDTGAMNDEFFDEARIFVAGGKGGNGAVHFHREKFVPRGGPDGGDGGDGGSVILRADRGLNTLQTFRHKRRFVAPAGAPGGPNHKHGKNGRDLIIPVPIGTVVRDAETGEILGDLISDGQTLVVARGGHGGLGNAHFATPTQQAPLFAEKGEPGQERWLILELKLIADVGLVGLPNAGKSTLLAAISAARPKIAPYPFTTLTPNLGVVVYDDLSFVVADIPGLIEGAHRGVGLGDRFLRHIERTLLLIHVIDASNPDPIADFEQVNAELRAYDAQLIEKRQLVALNKMDIPAARQRWPALRTEFERRGYRAFAISAATREGITELLAAVATALQQAWQERNKRAARQAEGDVFVFTNRPHPDHFDVFRKQKTLYVRGETVERLVRMTDFGSEGAINRLQHRLKRMGVLSALEREGITLGDRVVIGDVELVWEGELEPRLSVSVAPDHRRR